MDENLKNILIDAMGSNLSTLRSRLSLSQEELAELLGVTRQTISSFENGQRKMTWSVFLALILIFFRNEPTKRLLVAFNIYTPELNNFLIVSNKNNKEKGA